MHRELAVALIIAMPVILLPAACVRDLNIGVIFPSFIEANARRLAQETE